MTELRTDRFAEFAPFLLPLSNQLDTLALLNSMLKGEGGVPESWFRDLDRTSIHVQSLGDLECFVIICPTLEETWRFSQNLVRLTQNIVWDSDFAKDAAHLRLDSHARVYEPGIHRIHINLVDNWSGQSVNDIRIRNANCKRKRLAGIEAIQACVAQDPRLFRSMDGKNLPFCNLAGLRQGNGWDSVPRFFVGDRSKNYEINFDIRSSHSVNPLYAAPTLR